MSPDPHGLSPPAVAGLAEAGSVAATSDEVANRIQKKPKQHAIVISGPPASGKTHLSQRLAKEIAVPLLARDTIKESLFDSLGHSDRAWSMKLGAASYDILFAIAEASFQAGAPCVMLEANFTERAGQQLQALADRHGVSLIQVFCHARPEVLWQRFQQRVASGERHPGHVDGSNFEEARIRIAQTTAKSLSLKGALIDVDTSEPSDEMNSTVLRSINALLRTPPIPSAGP